MNNYEKIKELRELQVKQGELEAELRAFFKEKAQTDRKFVDGERVNIYDSKGELKGQGIIDGASIFIGLQGFDIADYAENEDKYQERLSKVRYKVLAIKKDGTPSTRVAFGNRTYTDTPEKHGWRDYIQKIQEPAKTL